MYFSYITVRDYARAEYIVKRSKFIATVKEVNSEQEAEAFVSDIRDEFYDATHNCYAYSVLLNNVAIKRFNDDGEPGGTAGMPILNVMEQKGLSNVALVVTRYFGGILLGAGGLVRAYSHAASLALEKAGFVKMLPAKIVIIRMPYHLLNSINNLINTLGASVCDSKYQEDVCLSILIESCKVDEFTRAAYDLSSGNIVIDIDKDAYIKGQSV